MVVLVCTDLAVGQSDPCVQSRSIPHLEKGLLLRWTGGSGGGGEGEEPIGAMLDVGMGMGAGGRGRGGRDRLFPLFAATTTRVLRTDVLGIVTEHLYAAKTEAFGGGGGWMKK